MLPFLSTNNFSPTFAPIRKPCAMCDGGSVRVFCANKKNFVGVVIPLESSL